MTATALDVLKTTNDAIKTECDTLLSNSPTEPVQNSTYTIDKMTQNNIQDKIEHSLYSTDDKNNNTPEIISKEYDDSPLIEEFEPEVSPRSETFISVISHDQVTSSSSVDLNSPRDGETSFDLSDFSVDTQDFSESEKIDSLKRERYNVNTRDFFVPSEKPTRRKWEVKMDHYSPSAEVVNKHTEEEVSNYIN